MKDIIPAKKQSPILGLSGMGGGVGSNLGGSLDAKPYVDDVFSTYAYYGNSTEGHVINNGIDLAGEGGLVWVKKRSGVDNHVATHVPGTILFPNTTGAASTGNTNFIESFNSNGFTLGGGASGSNASGETTISWTFRKQKGFFDVVTYTGNGVAGRQVPHNLECKPGLVIVKCISSAGEWWYVYHKDLGATKHLKLDTDNAVGTNVEPWNNTEPTSTHFTLAQYNSSNGSGKSYVAYLFAGGDSTAATAKSVLFDGSGDYLSIPSSPDFNFGTGDFTVEGWCYRNGGQFILFDHLMGADQFIIFSYSGGDIRVYSASGGGHLQSNVNPGNKKWFHLAVQRKSGVLEFFIDGQKASSTPTFTVDITQSGAQIGRSGSGGYCDGLISNLRVVKGTAIYTSSFKPSTVPLTSISGTVLLCCNNSSVTGSTVTPGTITSYGNVAASTNIPFDDPEGFKFGEEEDQNIIKCGSYAGSGASGLEINLGWQPSWILIKNTNDTQDWTLWDSIRGIVSNGHDTEVRPNTNAGDYTGGDYLDLTPIGFKLKTGQSRVNTSGQVYVYMAIRSSDGLVGKPARAGTDAFAMDAGGNTPLPTFAANFPVDYIFTRDINGNGAEMYSTGRLVQKTYLVTQTTAAESTSNAFVFDYNLGCCGSGLNSTFQAWMWKRGKGMDVVTYTGNSISGRQLPHSLSQTPEMIWIKTRTTGNEWVVGHKGLNGGTNPWEYSLHLQNSDAEADTAWTWADTAPTSTHFTLHSDGYVNSSSQNYIAMLFASVTGISKVGYYTGNGTGGSSTQTITTGFQPRFIIIKRSNSAENWLVFDTVRGWAAGNDKSLKLNSTDAQDSGTWDVGEPTSTGFTLVGNFPTTNASGGKYIYYAHA